MATPLACLRHALSTSVPDLSRGSARGTSARRSSLLLGATAALSLTLFPGTAVATPGDAPPSAQQLLQMAAAASHQLEVVSEQVNTAQEEFQEQQTAAAAADQAAAQAEARLVQLAPQIRQIARSAYQQGGNHLQTLDVLLTSKSADDFVSQLGTLNAIAGHTNQVVAEVAATADSAKKDQARADRARADARKTLDEITSAQSQLQAQIADYQQRYAALTAPPQVSTVQPDRTFAAMSAPVVAAVVAPSGAAQTAVNTALAQVGKPYVFGAAGPNGFDCSGLTQYSYAAAGVSLPHSSSMQSTMGTPVSRNQLQPGDLVFFYSPVSHVAMYIGNGEIVHASTSGQPVKVVPLASMPDYNSARRIG